MSNININTSILFSIILLLLVISICNSYITSTTLSSSLYNHYTHQNYQHPSCLNIALSTMPQADLTPAVDKFSRLPPGVEKTEKYFMRYLTSS